MRCSLLPFCLSLLAMAGLPVLAQSYQTSFTDVKFDRAKNPAVFHGGFEVDPATGAVSMNIPLGPGIGARGIHFVPTYTSRQSPQAQTICLGILPDETHSYYLPEFKVVPTGSGESSLSPGLMTVPIAEPLPGELAITNPDGSATSIVDYTRTPVLPTGTGNPTAIMKAFGFDPAQGWKLAGVESTPGSLVPPVYIGSQGELIIGLEHPTLAPLRATYASVTADGVTPIISFFPPPQLLHYPSMYLSVHGETAYLFSFAALRIQTSVEILQMGYEQLPPNWDGLQVPNLVPPNGDTSVITYSPSQALYRISKILNRFGESVAFTCTDVTQTDQTAEPLVAETGYTATWTEPTGETRSVEVLETTLGHVTVSYTNNGVKKTYYTLAGGPISVDAPRHSDSESRWLGTRPRFQACTSVSLKHEITGETLTPQTLQSPDWRIANTEMNTRVTLTGRQLDYHWTKYQYRPNLDPDSWNGYFGSLAQDVNTLRGWVRYCVGVDRVTETDLTTGETRTTQYLRRTPNPDTTSTTAWLGTPFFDTQVVHPDGKVTTYYYTRPVTTGTGGPGFSNADQMQTLAHLKHVIREIREYPDKTTADADRDTAVNASTATRITVFDRLCLFNRANPSEEVPAAAGGHNAVPEPTRERTWDRLNRIMTCKEKLKWDANARAWTMQVTQTANMSTPAFDFVQCATPSSTAPTAGYQHIQTTTTTTFTPLWSQWWPSRIASASTTVTDPTTGALTSTTRVISNQTTTYGSSVTDQLHNRIQSVSQSGWDNKAIQTTFTFLSETAGDRKAILPSNASLTGGDHANAGACGVSQYVYDNYGTLSKIFPKGVAWNMGRTTDPFLGVPTAQSDSNQVTTQYTWDEAGRLMSVAPPGEQVTSYIYDTDNLGVTIQRGAEKSQIRFNGFGQLVLERRWSDSTVSHRLHSYDKGGRKRWESIWRSGAGQESQANVTLGANDTTRIFYDSYGRVTRVIDPMAMRSIPPTPSAPRPSPVAYVGMARTPWHPREPLRSPRPTPPTSWAA